MPRPGLTCLVVPLLVAQVVVDGGCSLERDSIAPRTRTDPDSGRVDRCTDPELCDGIDNDCDPLTLDGADDPRVDVLCDGLDTDLCLEGRTVCGGGAVHCNDTTTDDVEICNMLDDDCDGMVDEDPATGPQAYPDTDGDGYGVAAGAIVACTPPAGYADNDTDCNDGTGTVHPGATEGCNSVDDDCDGTYDEGCPCVGEVHSGHIYYFCDTTQSWTAARDTCRARGMRLATITSDAENDWVHGRVRAYGGGTWWMGLNDRGTEGTWVWEDGSTSGFKRWGPREPNDFGAGEDCVELNFFFGTNLWNDARCRANSRFVCEGTAP